MPSSRPSDKFASVVLFVYYGNRFKLLETNKSKLSRVLSMAIYMTVLTQNEKDSFHVSENVLVSKFVLLKQSFDMVLRYSMF